MAISIFRSLIVLGAFAATCSLAAIVGCQATATTATAGATTIPAGTAPAVVSGKSGAQIWSENCGRCHNIRSPSSYNAVQWEVAVHDMRVRANLTGEEQRKVTEFLKAAAQ